ncbi:MAG TPA: hypothetical protein VHE30_04800 [Polyangiaceae bacterium]|nr:hypothetical protein [Polyangiaceae bacterium]
MPSTALRTSTLAARLTWATLLGAGATLAGCGSSSGKSPGNPAASASAGGAFDVGSGGALAGGAPGAGGAASGGSGTGGTLSSGGAASEDASTGGAAGADAGTPEDGGEDLWVQGPPVRPPTKIRCITDVETEEQPQVPCDGISFDLTIPPRCLTTECGMIFDVHGGTMSGAMEEKNTRLSELGKKYGYIVVHPNAFAGLWSYGVDDPKVLQFMLDMRDAFHVDPKRIHMTGLSQGGYMTWRFVCQHGDLLASAAPAAAAGAANISIEVGCTFTGQDVPSGEMDVLYMHGEFDGLVNYPNAVTLRDAVTAFWKTDAGTKIAGDGTYERTRFTEPGGHVFEFLKHEYQSPSAIATVAIKGHCFPGSPDQSVTLPGQLMSFGCTPPNSFDWGEEVMKFFVAHPKR